MDNNDVFRISFGISSIFKLKFIINKFRSNLNKILSGILLHNEIIFFINPKNKTFLSI